MREWAERPRARKRRALFSISASLSSGRCDWLATGPRRVVHSAGARSRTHRMFARLPRLRHASLGPVSLAECGGAYAGRVRARGRGPTATHFSELFCPRVIRYYGRMAGGSFFTCVIFFSILETGRFIFRKFAQKNAYVTLLSSLSFWRCANSIFFFTLFRYIYFFFLIIYHISNKYQSLSVTEITEITQRFFTLVFLLKMHEISAQILSAPIERRDVFGFSLNNTSGSREDNVLLSRTVPLEDAVAQPSGAIWVSFAQIPSDQKVAHTLPIFATLSSRRWTPRCRNDNSAKVSRPCWWRRRVRRTAAETGRHVVLWLRSDARDKRKHCAVSPIDGDVITESQRTRFCTEKIKVPWWYRAKSGNVSDECWANGYALSFRVGKFWKIGDLTVLKSNFGWVEKLNFSIFLFDEFFVYVLVDLEKLKISHCVWLFMLWWWNWKCVWWIMCADVYCWLLNVWKVTDWKFEGSRRCRETHDPRESSLFSVWFVALAHVTFEFRKSRSRKKVAKVLSSARLPRRTEKVAFLQSTTHRPCTLS